MKRLNFIDLKDFLEQKVHLYNRSKFIEEDPISIPHRFSKKEDIEISGFLTATIAWGQRATILKNANIMMKLMDDEPFDFIKNFSKKDTILFRNFVHRTFNSTDCLYFLKSLQNIYRQKKNLENLFIESFDKNSHMDYKESINTWRRYFFSLTYPLRSTKHFAHPEVGSAAKRINMFLRWMIRKDSAGVDFGLWNLSPALLTCPLDVHSGRVARKLGLLHRNQNDWKAAAELTSNLRKFDSSDPVKYDFALFGLGVFEKF